MDWQTGLVIVIELAALVFLVHRVFSGRRPRRSAKPDVPLSALVRKRS